MNSTGSAQPRCAKSTVVQPSSWRNLHSTVVPIHSGGPSTTSQVTPSPGSDDRTFMSNPPGGKRKAMVPPGVGSPAVSVVHQPARPSMVVRAS